MSHAPPYTPRRSPASSLFGPAVTVHGAGHAGAALRPGFRVLLLSAPGAGWHGGAGWWRALVAAARAAAPDTPCADWLDCGAAPGAAMAALRLGQRNVILHQNCAAFAAVSAAAETIGAAVWPNRPPSLDLADPRASRLLAAWLAPGETATGDSGEGVG